MSATWILRERPQGGELRTGAFTLEDRPDEPLADGMVRVRNLWASVDPYMLGLADGTGGYVPALPLGAAMRGGAIGEVIESRSPMLREGATIVHNAGWRARSVVAAADCTTVAREDDIPLQHHLGMFGMPGMTAYFGLLRAGEARRGETLFVSSAAGAVGSALVQIAKASGLRVVGSAAGAAKCDAVRALGADVVIDRTAGDIASKLGAAAPDGLDVYFDNVGGDHLAAAIDHARTHMRVVLCGMISGYGRAQPLVVAEPMRLVAKRITLRGHFAPDHYGERAAFLEAMRGWYRGGALACPTRVFDGLERMPEALASLYGDGAIGKVLVRLA